jgi:signal transduction histidine kinase
MTRLRVLQIEDQEDDALLVASELRRGGFEPQCTRVDTVPELRAVLGRQRFDLITSDYGLPRFDAPSALSVVKELSPDDVPFIIVSGTIPDTAVSSAMKAGAHDFVSKNDLRRLVPAVRRELKEAESRQARRYAEARFQSLARSLDGLVVSMDRDLLIDGCYGRGIPGGPQVPSAFLGTRLSDFFEGSERHAVVAACRRVLAGAAREERLDIDRPHDAGIAHLQITFSPMVAEDGGRVTGLVGYVRDVTAERVASSQRVASDRMATIGTLAAGVAHEINNPLSALLSNLHMLGRDLAHLSAGHVLTPTLLGELTEILDDANTAAGVVRTIAGDLRTFSRQADEAPQPVSITRVLESALRLARNRIEPRARIVRDYAEAPPVLAVESSLGQVFLNLLVNAAQALPEGHSDFHEVRVKVSVDEAAGRVVVAVSDTGHGMSTAVKERLFTPFFTTKPSGIGTGLGLSICRRIVTGFGGDITVESAEGQGSTFRVSLPIAPPGPPAPTWP